MDTNLSLGLLFEPRDAKTEPRDAKTMTLGTDLPIHTSQACQILIIFIVHVFRSAFKDSTT